MKAATHFSDEQELRTAARMLVLAHAFFRNRYDRWFVELFLDTKFKALVTEYWSTGGRMMIMRIKVLLFGMLATSVPYIYINYIMDYPCKPEEMQLKDDDVTNKIWLSQLHCEVQDDIRSPLSLLVLPVAVVASAVIFIGSILLDMLLLCVFGSETFRPGEFGRNLSRKYLYGLTGRAVEDLKYTHPVCFSATCACYFIIMGEMVALSIIQLSGVAALVGYAVGQVILKMASLILVPDQKLITIVDAKIEQWPYFGQYATSCRGVFARLRQQKGEPTIQASIAELQAILELSRLRRLVEEMQVQGKQFTSISDERSDYNIQHSYVGGYIGDIRLVFETLPAREVFIVDTDEIVPTTTQPEKLRNGKPEEMSLIG